MSLVTKLMFTMNNTIKKSLMLDVGGVIVVDKKREVLEDYSKSLNITTNDLQWLLNQYRLIAMKGQDIAINDLLKQLEVDWITSLQLVELLDMMWKSESPNDELIARIIELKNKHSFNIVLATNNYGGVEKILHRLNISRFWDGVVDSSDIGYMKPNEVFFDKALEIMKINSSDAYFVDDDERNVLSAKKMGIAGWVHSDNDETVNAITKFFAK